MNFNEQETKLLQDNGFRVVGNEASFKVGHSCWVQVEKTASNQYSYTFIDDGGVFKENKTKSLKTVINFKKGIVGD